MFDHLLESSQLDDSNKWLNIGFVRELGIIENKKLPLSGAQFDQVKIGNNGINRKKLHFKNSFISMRAKTPKLVF